MTPHLTLLTFSVQRFVADLAARHHVSYQPTELDLFAQSFMDLAGEPLQRDDTRDTLLALRRANVINADVHASLLLAHLHECRTARPAP